MLDEALKISLQTGLQIPAVTFAEEVVVSDDQLVEATIAGDETAFAEIFERYKRGVTRTAGRFFREQSDVEEMVQQSFAKAYFSLRRYRGGEERSFVAWLTRIAVNVCYDEFRRRRRKNESLFSEAGSEEDDYVLALADGRQPTAENSLANAQIADQILSSLPAEDRVAMVLVYSEEYSIDEAARMIGISRSNLKSRLFRCRSYIKRRFSHLFD